MPELVVTEGTPAGEEDQLFIELDRPIELSVTVRLIVQYDSMFVLIISYCGFQQENSYPCPQKKHYKPVVS